MKWIRDWEKEQEEREEELIKILAQQHKRKPKNTKEKQNETQINDK